MAGLSNWAFRERWAWIALAAEATARIEAGQPLPPILREWTIDALKGKRTAPKERRNDRRDFYIAVAVRYLIRCGHREHAAVHMVAPAVHRSPGAVYSILRRFKLGPFVKKAPTFS